MFLLQNRYTFGGGLQCNTEHACDPRRSEFLSPSYSPENLVYAMLWCECVWVRLCISDIPSGELPYQSPLKFAWPRAKLEDKNNPFHERRRRRRRKIFLFLIWPNFFYQVLAGSNKNWIKAAIFLCEISLGHLCGNFLHFFGNPIIPMNKCDLICTLFGLPKWCKSDLKTRLKQFRVYHLEESKNIVRTMLNNRRY